MLEKPGAGGLNSEILWHKMRPIFDLIEALLQRQVEADLKPLSGVSHIAQVPDSN
jgi:hypothetical protein